MDKDSGFESKADLRRDWVLSELAIAARALRTLIHAGQVEVVLGATAVGVGIVNQEMSTAFTGAGIVIMGLDRMALEWEHRMVTRKRAAYRRHRKKLRNAPRPDGPV